MNKKEKKVIDFTKVQVETEIDTFEEFDISKAIGNTVHQNTSDIGVDDMARRIYHEGKVGMSAEEARLVNAIVQQSNLLVAIKQAVSGLLTK